jgi:hypothetical protein
MKLKEFKYRKPNSTEVKERKVWEMESDDTYLSGIDLSTLDQDEQDKVSKILMISSRA